MSNPNLAASLEDAVEKLNASCDNILRWIDVVRPEDGTRGRFKWAAQSSRGANIGSTFYVLSGLELAGLIQRLITPEDKAAGIAWLAAMERDEGQFIDPELWERRSPHWPEHAPWPSAPMRATVNQYAQGCRGIYRGERVDDLAASAPPPGWPQADDDPADTIEWIRQRPFHENAWSAGSHATRMLCFLLRWQAEGRFPMEGIVHTLRYLYEIQDPHTGLWGAPGQPRNIRINGAFKLFVSLVDQLELPVPYGRKLIDEVMDELTREGYEQEAGGCDEFDNWYVLSLLHGQNPDYRNRAIKEQAVRSLHRIVDSHTCPDGGFSYGPRGQCASSWVGFDMCAEAMDQGDAIGFAVLARAISLCVDILGLHTASPWIGKARMRDNFTDEETRCRIRQLLGAPQDFAGKRYEEMANGRESS